MKTLTLSILQFNTFVKNILDAEEFLSNISVFGEVTNFKMSGGHAYFDLKEEGATLSCVKFGASDLNIKNGDLVTVYGKVNFYVKSGRLNFVVSRAILSGLGDLYAKFLLLKEKLEKEGLFKEEIKKSIPKYAKKIGVVTSETGAVIRDIIHVTRKKNPFTDIILYPSKVQGENAENEIINGIRYFDSREDIDTIIVARGGGSIEDLSPFNTEKLARAIFECNKPLISAVGHETDFTLCDFVSDLRVPTPSVAAEVAVFDYYKTYNDVVKVTDDIEYYISKNIKQYKENVANTINVIIDKLKLKTTDSKNLLLLKIKDIENRVLEVTSQKKISFELVSTIISKSNPLEILKKGYLVAEKDNKKISSIKAINSGDKINIKFYDGEAVALIDNIKNN